MIKKLPDGRWLVDVEPVKNKRIRKRFPTKGEALRYERHVRASVAQNTGWLSTATDKRRLSAIVSDWYNLHGHALRDGKRRYDALLAIARSLGDPVSATLTGNQFSAYRSQRIEQGISSKTLNNHLGYFKAVFNELRALGHVGYDNPLDGVRPLKVPERELSWLTIEQIGLLLEEIRERTENPHVEVITLICLATGCRWSEAESLTLDKLRNGAITFAGTRTKSAKNRVVPVDPDLYQRIASHLGQWREMSSSITAFRRALKRTGIELPAGQASHALRHTFASHFVMQGGNILVLQRILGHSSITMTMRYAHLAPGHLQEAVKLSPLRHFDTFSTPERKSGTPDI